MGQFDDTICAIATPIGEGGVGILRISGPHSTIIASKLVTLRSGQRFEDIRSHTLYMAEFLPKPRPFPILPKP